MNKKELIEKLNALDNLTDDEKSYLIELVNTKKKYGLVWEDKPEDAEILLESHLPVLKEVPQRRILGNELPEDENPKEENPTLFNAEKTENESAEEKCNPNHILIEGDNLHALTALTFTHEGKIDVIYIDPPYNTGNKSWKYNNDYIDKEDPWKHSKWVSFIYKRLKIAKRLLTDDGIVIIAIDHNEQENLGLILKELFANKEMTCVTVVHNPRGIQGNNFSYTHEFAYFLYPSKNVIGEINRLRDKFDWSNLRNWGGESERKFGKSLFFPLRFQNNNLIEIGEVPKEDFHPSNAFSVNKDLSITIWPIDTKGIERKWRYSRNSLLEIKDKIRIIENKNGYQAQILKEKDRPKTVWSDTRYDANIYGSQLIAEIIETNFPFPKSIYTVSDCLQITTAYNKNSIILDFFAGSGTTLHATMQLNAEDGGSRQCILVTNNENKIAEEVCYERNKRVIEGYTKPNGQKVAGLKKNNLRYYQTDFIEREPSLKNKRALTRLATELLCIKDDCYFERSNVYEIGQWGRFFMGERQNGLLIVYDDRQISKALPIIPKIFAANPELQPINTYVFAQGQYPYTEDFQEILPLVNLCALPDAIYKAYLNVLPKKKKRKLKDAEPMAEFSQSESLDLFGGEV
jgi:adenine-specific DNA-methyltransferase